MPSATDIISSSGYSTITWNENIIDGVGFRIVFDFKRVNSVFYVGARAAPIVVGVSFGLFRVALAADADDCGELRLGVGVEDLEGEGFVGGGEGGV
jgi:hypothetical protein